MSGAQMKKGLIIVNTGDGKGKTTAALGMVSARLGTRLSHLRDSIY